MSSPCWKLRKRSRPACMSAAHRSGVLAPLTSPDETQSVLGLLARVLTEPPTAALTSARMRRRSASILGTGTSSTRPSPTRSTVVRSQAATESSPAAEGGGLNQPSTMTQHDWQRR